MNDGFLKVRLQRVVRRYQWLALWRKLAACWAIAALVAVGVAWVQHATGRSSALTLPVIAVIAGSAAVVIAFLHFLKPPELRWVARKIEARHPDLNGILLTAVQQQFDGKQDLGYLQYRVLQEATARSQEQDWRDTVPRGRMIAMQGVHVVALLLFAFALAGLRVPHSLSEPSAWVGSDGVSITPGDTKVEKGDSLVVLARFGGTLPPSVNLVLEENGAAARSMPLVKSLADPVFGGSVTEVANDLIYHLEYRGQRTKDFKVTVFEHPRLVRSDVDLNFPDYTKLAPKHIEDTRRVSAVEGTKLDFALQLNKPVKTARLVPREARKGAEGGTPITLAVSPDKAVATLKGYVPAKSLTYDLQLIDDEGRANKVAAPFVIDVQPNRPPEIRIASPRGDVRPSALEELTFEGTVWDDFGTAAYGIAYSVAGQGEKLIELGKDGGAKEKRSFGTLLKLEELGAKPDDLIAWYAWADDIGPDGKVRRTNGDLYFAEIRPFDEIFRESQNMESGEQQGGGQGNQTRKLTELQKQIINATWKLQREGAKGKYTDDVKVVLDSQQQALGQAEEAAEEARGPRQQAMWKQATQEMQKAIDKLTEAQKTPGPLAQALPAEQAAYQALLKMSARETQVTRRGRQQGGGGGNQANQRQLDQLDLQQAENRYETQRQARAPQNQERREQLAVMNRLQELARRQNDINERMKELQTALQEAKTDQQREDIKRRLKRLEEEQRQLLADADEVRQRMDRAENQSSMSQQRQQLDQTREDIQKAADAAADGSVSQALASGTRAQRQLQDMRDELRKQNSSQFAEDLRDMRNEARDLARQQEEIGQKLDQLANGSGQPQRKTLGDNDDRKEMLDKLNQQKERMNKLVERATQVSEQAENTEPLLSRQLYDSIRKVAQDDANAVKQTRDELMNGGRMTRDLYDRLQKAGERDGGGKALDLTSDMLREGYLPQARQAGQRARGEIDELKRGVERAAESVLGDDAEQLRLARSELDSLTDQLQREIAQAGSAQRNDQPQDGQQPGQRDGRQASNQEQKAQSKAGQQGQRGQQPGEPGEQPGEQAGERGDPSQQMANNDGQPGKQQGRQGQRGQQAQSGQQGSPSPDGQAGGGGQGGDNRMANGADNQATDGGRRSTEEQRRLALSEAERRRRLMDRGQLSLGQDRRGGNNAGGFGIDDLLRGGYETNRLGDGGGFGGPWNWAPLTGEDFARWNERLRDVEEIIENPELRNEIAEARERARLLRREFRQDLKKPDWTVVELQILKPLLEVRSRVAEELARRESKDSLAPIDRDPVPNRYAESVRRYYEELGKDK